jgi:hypothetical protein
MDELMVTTKMEASKVATRSETQTAKGLWELTVKIVRARSAKMTMTPKRKQPLLKTGRHMIRGRKERCFQRDVVVVGDMLLQTRVVCVP